MEKKMENEMEAGSIMGHQKKLTVVPAVPETFRQRLK